MTGLMRTLINGCLDLSKSSCAVEFVLQLMLCQCVLNSPSPSSAYGAIRIGCEILQCITSFGAVTIQSPSRLATSIVLHTIEGVAVRSVLVGHIPKNGCLRFSIKSPHLSLSLLRQIIDN